MKPVTALRTLSLCALLLAPSSSYASPFSVMGTPVSAEHGTSITISLLDSSVNKLEAADFWLTFDGAVFSLLSPPLGPATGGFKLGTGALVAAGDSLDSLLQLDFSLATGGSPVDGFALSLVEVSLLIKADAPLGDSALVFAAHDFSDYEIPRTVGLVTVKPRQAGGLPEPSSSMLLAMAMLSLVAFRRRRSAGLRLVV